jgi:acetylornithine deacetylase/succinyl-diaminopimelate desuccinylase-like protein
MLSDGATSNAHGLNERIRVQTLIEGREFLYRLTEGIRRRQVAEDLR